MWWPAACARVWGRSWGRSALLLGLHLLLAAPRGQREGSQHLYGVETKPSSHRMTSGGHSRHWCGCFLGAALVKPTALGQKPSPSWGATSPARKPLQLRPEIATIPRKLIPFSLLEFPFLRQRRHSPGHVLSCWAATEPGPDSRPQVVASPRAVAPLLQRLQAGFVRLRACARSPCHRLPCFAKAAPCTRNFPGLEPGQRRIFVLQASKIGSVLSSPGSHVSRARGSPALPAEMFARPSAAGRCLGSAPQGHAPGSSV